MILIIIFIFLFFILWKLSKNQLETFHPAWNDHTLYSQLSKRVRIGTWRGWLNINGLATLSILENYSNIEIILFDSSESTIDALLITKHIDIAYVTEADYGIYISKKIQEKKNNQIFNKKYILQNKNKILKNFTTRRVLTFYTIYRFLLVDNFKINKPYDIVGKTIQITNLTNAIHLLDLDLLKEVNYIKLFREADRSVSKYESINSLGLQNDAYFTQYDINNSNMIETSYNKNVSIIDLYSDNDEDKTNPFPKAEVILDKYFYLKKDKMNIQKYPEIVERRKKAIEYYNLPYDASNVNCYSFKLVMLSTEDVNSEAIYLFTKSVIDNIKSITKILNHPDVNIKDMYKNSLSDILPIHPAVYNPNKYKTE
jgi:TRAP-type uncharacterized transport system substrate-binding protein